MNNIHPQLIDSFAFYAGRGMTDEERAAAEKVRPVSKPLYLYNWLTTDGEEYGKGASAISHQVAIDRRAKDPHA